MARRPARTWVLAIPFALALAIAVATLVRTQRLGPDGREVVPVAGRFIDAAFTGLLDATGEARDERAFAGRQRLVAFGFTSCPDVCPSTLAAVHAALEQLGPRASNVQPVFITVDPARDNAARLGAYLQAFDPRIIGLRGPEPATAAVARHYGVRYARRVIDAASGAYVVDHTAQIYLVGQGGRILAIIPATQGARALASAIVAAVAAAVPTA